MAAPVEGTFDRDLLSTGINFAVWNGGTITQLADATKRVGGVSVAVFVNGASHVLVPDAPDYVNADFATLFPSDMVPSGTIVVVTRRTATSI